MEEMSNIVTDTKKKEEFNKAEEFALLKRQYMCQKADRIISALYSKMNSIRQKECEEAINKLKTRHTIGDIEREILDETTNSFVDQFLAGPIVMIRNIIEDDFDKDEDNNNKDEDNNKDNNNNNGEYNDGEECLNVLTKLFRLKLE